MVLIRPTKWGPDIILIARQALIRGWQRRIAGRIHVEQVPTKEKSEARTVLCAAYLYVLALDTAPTLLLDGPSLFGRFDSFLYLGV
jgi:hypothetical protein